MDVMNGVLVIHHQGDALFNRADRLYLDGNFFFYVPGTSKSDRVVFEGLYHHLYVFWRAQVAVFSSEYRLSNALHFMAAQRFVCAEIIAD